MISAFIFISVSSSAMWALAPRFFMWCDVVLTRQRLCGEYGHVKKTTKTAKHTFTTESDSGFLAARHFNELARLTRAHVPMRDALHTITNDASTHEWLNFMQMLETSDSVDETFRLYSLANRSTLAVQVLRASISSGNFIPSALDQAALLLRDEQRTKGEIEIAAAQARLTMRILTSAPLFIMLLGLLVSESFRRIITSPGVIVICLVALLLNRTGSRWTLFLIRRLNRPASIDELLHLVTVLAVHVRAGHSLPSACQQLLNVSAIGDAIATAFQRGESFDNALVSLRNHTDRFGDDIATILVSAYRDGQPALETIQIITNEARLRREQHTQVLIRQLPTQLTGPVVLCALPSFILLVIVPLIIAQFSTLSGSFSGAPS